MEPAIPGGQNICVTQANRREYVVLDIDSYLDCFMQQHFEALFWHCLPGMRFW